MSDHNIKKVISNCEFETKSDFLTGMYLIIRIDDSDLDLNALHTIQDDCPDFILPFNYKSINGKTEFTYKVGQLCNLKYFYGDVSHEEYINLWKGLLVPLLECGDWFMRPDGFVLNTDYLYFDKSKRTISYVYVPALRGCSGEEAFKEMAVEVSKNIKVSDPVLENKVLRSIINNFNPNDFLKMLLEYYCEKKEKQNTAKKPWEQLDIKGSKTDDPDVCEISFENDAIDLRANNINATNSQTSSKHKKDSQMSENDHGLKIFGGKGKKNSETKRNGFKNSVPGSLLTQLPFRAEDTAGVTQETKISASGTGLRCVGRAGLPQYIETQVEEGKLFTIGRYDVNAGKKRSDFEFDARTKAVSRRHAAIERYGDSYKIVDLASSAGTFVNNKKIPPNTPVDLQPGTHISFGNLGADYVWDIT